MQRPRSGSGALLWPLTSPAQRTLVREMFSFPFDFVCAGGIVNSVESVVIEMPEFGDTVKVAVFPNTSIALCAGMRVAQSEFWLCLEAVGRQPEIWIPCWPCTRTTLCLTMNW